MASDLELLLTRQSDFENEAAKEDYIDRLETQISQANQVLAAEGVPLIPDAIYDTLIDILRELKPDSSLLHNVWSEDDPDAVLDVNLDQHLIRVPMLSVMTVKHPSDKPVKDFHARLPVGQVEVCSSVKLNGHGARAVWRDGYLERATSRGRSTAGKDLTPQFRSILGDYCEAFASLGVVECRCEVLLPFSHLEAARQYNQGIKSAFSGVASMIRASASPEE